MSVRSSLNPLFAAAGLLLALVAPACAQKSDSGQTPAHAAPLSPSLQQFKAAGKAAPLTVAPTRLAGRSMSQVGEFIAMMLERAGMTELQTSATPFAPPADADLEQSALAFTDFVRANPPASEYILFTDILGTPKTGVAEIRSIVANKQGEIIWKDRQAKGDADFDRIAPKEPMQCCLLIIERLRPLLGIADPTREGAPQGPIAQRWQKNALVPDQAEIDAIKQRGKLFRDAASAGTATLLVYPAHAGDTFSPESAATISSQLNDRKLLHATASATGPTFDIARDMNEQKSLWSMARAFSDSVKRTPPSTDYVLFVDYLMGKNAAGETAVGGVGGVHFAICNQKGELVLVDFQNDHFPDFTSIAPKSREDCDKLILKRLEGYCK